MQSQSVILLAEVLHTEAQAEAARLQIVNQACAQRPTASGVIASAQRRLRIAPANAAAHLHMHMQLQRILTTIRGKGSRVVPRPSVDSLLMEL
jgi:hypothetical protein